MNGEPRNVRENGSAEKRRISRETGLINKGTEEQMAVFGYLRSSVRNALLWVAIILTLGIVRLVLHWQPHWRLYIAYYRCPLDLADTFLVVEKYQGKYTSYYVEHVNILSAKDSVKTYQANGRETKHSLVRNETHKDLGLTQVQYEQQDLRLHLDDGTYRDAKVVRGIWVKRLFYVWDASSFTFIRLAGLEQGYSTADFHASAGLTSLERTLRQVVYGYNDIKVPMQTVLNMIVMELLNPFYIFQLFSILLWFAERYIFYPVAIIIMTTFGVTSYVIQTRKSQRMLYETVQAEGTVEVWHDGGVTEDLPFSHLVPGDVILIPAQGCEMQCDAMLLNGQCIMNESMLTGESMPVTKIALPRYNTANYSPHTLFCGTRVIQARSTVHEPVKAVVLRTGYLTTKGNLVRSILYPPPADFQFEKDSYKWIWILAVVAFMGFLWTLVSKSSRGIPPLDMIVKALDLLTICIPPALPAAMTVGKIYAQNRLEKARIYCINSRVINVSGAINCMCFDKTGTLTEDGLDFYCAVPVKDAHFGSPVVAPAEGMPGEPLQRGMAVSHSLTLLDGTLSGDPLDLKMFESSGWILRELSMESNDTLKYGPNVQSIVQSRPTNNKFIDSEGDNNDDVDDRTEIQLYHQFTFDSTLQRMSVITKESNRPELVLYCKGSPEMVMSLSKRETVPQDILKVLERYTQKGYRVIGLGRRTFSETSYEEIQMKNRQECERQLDFLGIIVLENRLKPETAPVIEVLRKAEIKTIMITGDNMETAISVARECGIIDRSETIVDVAVLPPVGNTPAQVVYTATANTSLCITDIGHKLSDTQTNIDIGYRFSMTGKSWQVLKECYPALLPRIVTRGVVFARMSSEQKQQLILELKEVGYCVGMCGDGANDCGALKAANVGISLSDAEASVASPFTSKEDNISCVLPVVREGRAALITAFGIFKFMVLYSLVEFVSVFVLYSIDSNLTDFQFLFVDIFLVLQFAISFGKTEAYTGEIVKETPMTSLMSIVPVASITLQIALMTGIQVAAFYTIQFFPWFVPFEYDENNEYYYNSYENYAVFAASMGQYLIMVVIFSEGAPYRKPIYTNYVLTISLLVMGVIIIYIAVYPAEWVLNLMEIMLPPTFDMRLIIVGYWIINYISSHFLEDILCGYILAKKILPKLRDIRKSSQKYVVVELELQANTEWPPLSSK